VLRLVAYTAPLPSPPPQIKLTDRNALILPWRALISSSFWFSSVWSVVLRLER
jgi:hypothetical protein